MLGSYKLLVSQKCKNGKKNLTYPGLISPDLTCPIGKKNVGSKEVWSALHQKTICVEIKYPNFFRYNKCWVQKI